MGERDKDKIGGERNETGNLLDAQTGEMSSMDRKRPSGISKRTPRRHHDSERKGSSSVKRERDREYKKVKVGRHRADCKCHAQTEKEPKRHISDTTSHFSFSPTTAAARGMSDRSELSELSN